MADLEDGPRMFSLKQVISLLGAVTVMSGGGAALTVSASDAVQDTKIEKLESETVRIAEELRRTTGEVHVVQTQVAAVKETVDDTREDIAELRGLVIRALQRGSP